MPSHGSLNVTVLDQRRGPNLLVSRNNSEPHPLLPKTWIKYLPFAGLAVTTLFSFMLLGMNVTQWYFSEHAYDYIQNHRDTTQLLIQILSNALAGVYIVAFCNLINYATRLHFIDRPGTLSALRLWTDLCSPRMDWSLPIGPMVVLVFFLGLTAVPSAIWAGALTPVPDVVNHLRQECIPGYDNTSLIREWPADLNASAPSIRTYKGSFSYDPVAHMQDSLLNSAATASFPGLASIFRVRLKPDNSYFLLIGRSYGVGSAVGIFDGDVRDMANHVSYGFDERGYRVDVNCTYNDNSTSLPGTQASTSEEAVEFDVGSGNSSTNYLVHVTAGRRYSHLNAVRCAVDFIPTLFWVDVGLDGQNNISARQVTSDVEAVGNFSRGNLANVTISQLQLLSDSLLTPNGSILGNALNESITNYFSDFGLNDMPTLAEATLPGIGNAIMAMADDILFAYGGCTAHELLRTKAWRGMVEFDYMDPGALLLASAKSSNTSDADLPAASNSSERMVMDPESHEMTCMPKADGKMGANEGHKDEAVSLIRPVP
ncbi:hypothetical protein K461DRAFT_308951 [Myriangium duriaei CBS 260.36]|uniref:Uncharacterized protein n=1 Tax=Myriangium duriaei CBS 260.36 TaxID=1168546 RepID=A0A9P4J8E4_9PEZI|nr:hypothetical protein K461DRAFT_308951 [Myriangium duriaei CBS 260.36]